MDQYKRIVLKAPEGMHYIANQGEDGELILELVSSISITSSETADKFKYFVKITEQCRESIRKWLNGRKGRTNREKTFLQRVNQAIQNVNYDYWIASIEPSIANGKIYYAERENVCVGFSCDQWNEMSKNFAPERGSRQAELHELLIWYALRIVEYKWTLGYVANDPSIAGNYINAPNSTGNMEKTGARECGGYRDGQGNTYKIALTAEHTIKRKREVWNFKFSLSFIISKKLRKIFEIFINRAIIKKNKNK